MLEERGGKVIFHTRYNPYFKDNLKFFAVTDFIAELTAHIPPKSTHYIRRYGLYASRTRAPGAGGRIWSGWHDAHPAADATAGALPPQQEVERSKASSTWARLIAKV